MHIVAKILPDNCYSNNVLQPKGILIHHVSARNTAPDKPFDAEECCKIFRQYKVSAHYMVLRDGTIWQLVPPGLTAWHAGKSRFRGAVGLNQTFLGIEFIGDEEHDFTDEQYEAGAELVASMMRTHQIPTHMVTGHEIVSDERVRPDPKHDPGQMFDWLRFGALVNKWPHS